MPLALLLIGVIILVTAFRGTTGQLASRIKGDLIGPNNFTLWLLALLIIGGISYIPGFKGFANAFLVLIILGILLAHNGFFENFQAAINLTTRQTPTPQKGPTQ